MYIEFKPGEKYAAKNAETSDNIETFQDCGYVLKPDEIVVDIDKLPIEKIQKLIEAFDIQTQTVWTDRGVHFYFSKPEGSRRPQTGVCKLGFEIETKTSSNAPRGVTIKRNGVQRKIDNFGKREPFPDFFKTSKNYDSLLGMGDGDGRNEKLYRHKRKLKNCDDWYRILTFINNVIFDEPLPTREFNALARQESKEDRDKCEECEVADRLKRMKKFNRWGGRLWYWSYEKKKFIPQDGNLQRMVYDECEGKKTNFVDEVIKQIEYTCPLYDRGTEFRIKLKNGYLLGGKFYPYDDLDEFTPFSIDLEYDPNAEPVPIVDNYLSQLATDRSETGEYTEEDFEAYKNVILETMAFPMVVNPEMTRRLSRFAIFRGDGANGKGTLLQIIKDIYGSENCSYLSIENMGDDHYIPSMVGKLVNLGDDVEDKPIGTKPFKVIKNITTGDDIEIRRLYKDPEHVQILTKLIFTSNSDIRTFDKGPALKRRMYWMPMFNTVEKPDPKFIARITTEKAKRYWIKLLVEAYARLCNDGWTDSRICTDYNDQYHIHNDIAEMFVKEAGIDAMRGRTMTEVKEMFSEWNTDDDRKLSSKNFKRTLWETFKAGFGTRRSENSTTRVIMLQEETRQNVKPTFK